MPLAFTASLMHDQGTVRTAREACRESWLSSMTRFVEGWQAYAKPSLSFSVSYTELYLTRYDTESELTLFHDVDVLFRYVHELESVFDVHIALSYGTDIGIQANITDGTHDQILNAWWWLTLVVRLWCTRYYIVSPTYTLGELFQLCYDFTQKGTRAFHGACVLAGHTLLNNRDISRWGMRDFRAWDEPDTDPRAVLDCWQKVRLKTLVNTHDMVYYSGVMFTLLGRNYQEEYYGHDFDYDCSCACCLAARDEHMCSTCGEFHDFCQCDADDDE